MDFSNNSSQRVVICFQISIFDPLETASLFTLSSETGLWFAFKLVSLIHWKQPSECQWPCFGVVICFQISIFDPLETASAEMLTLPSLLWFAFKLVSLIHWKQRVDVDKTDTVVVICFQISIFDPLETALWKYTIRCNALWFAFKLVSLIHWKQLNLYYMLYIN